MTRVSTARAVCVSRRESRVCRTRDAWDVENTPRSRTYLERRWTSELSASDRSVPGRCATSKPSLSLSRPGSWAKTEIVDVFDAVGAAIRVDSARPEVLRGVLPRLKPMDGERGMASDESRYALTRLMRQAA